MMINFGEKKKKLYDYRQVDQKNKEPQKSQSYQMMEKLYKENFETVTKTIKKAGEKSANFEEDMEKDA